MTPGKSHDGVPAFLAIAARRKHLDLGRRAFERPFRVADPPSWDFHRRSAGRRFAQLDCLPNRYGAGPSSTSRHADVPRAISPGFAASSGATACALDPIDKQIMPQMRPVMHRCSTICSVTGTYPIILTAPFTLIYSIAMYLGI